MSTFRSALATAVEQIRASLASHPSAAEDNGAETGADLGRFAASRIDTQRFSALLAESRPLDFVSLDRIRKGFEVLSGLASRKAGLFRLHVDPGASLPYALSGALAEVGRVFGAARVVELSRSGRYVESEHAGYLNSFPFTRWNRAERNLAPPQVVHVNGADLHAEGLAEFLDGKMKIVVVVRGECPPAPLVRLISPGVFVMQTREEADIDRVAAWEGPGIAALVPEDAACFVHDPAAGPDLWDRVRIGHLPDGERRRRVGGLSAFQQSDQLRQLRALAARPPALAAPAAPGQGTPAPAAPGE
ncbi:MAG: hypothetical protein ACYTG6_13460, partial [Planctomycetota bacterium]